MTKRDGGKDPQILILHLKGTFRGIGERKNNRTNE